MANYADIPCIPLVKYEISQYVFNKEKPDDLAQQLSQCIIDLIKQRGFQDYDPQCVAILQICLTDFYNDLFIRFKEHIESLGCSITLQDVITRTLNDVMSINLKDLYLYMKKKCELYKIKPSLNYFLFFLYVLFDNIHG